MKAADAGKQEHFPAQQQAFTQAGRKVSIAPAAPERFPDRWYPPTNALLEVPGPLTGKPYRAVLVSDSAGVKVGDKAPRIEDVQTSMRDSAGRERTEGISGGVGVGEKWHPLKDIRVVDPVAHCSFQWSESVPAEVRTEYSERVALVQCAPKQIFYVDLDLSGLAYAHPTGNAIVLHGKVNGESYVGLRYPGRAAEGDQPGLSGRETWYSTDLRLQLASFELEGGGKRVQTLAITDLKRAEPDPAMFYPPEGYRIELQPARSQTSTTP